MKFEVIGLFFHFSTNCYVARPELKTIRLTMRLDAILFLEKGKVVNMKIQILQDYPEVLPNLLLR